MAQLKAASRRTLMFHPCCPWRVFGLWGLGYTPGQGMRRAAGNLAERALMRPVCEMMHMGSILSQFQSRRSRSDSNLEKKNLQTQSPLPQTPKPQTPLKP